MATHLPYVYMDSLCFGSSLKEQPRLTWREHIRNELKKLQTVKDKANHWNVWQVSIHLEDYIARGRGLVITNNNFSMK